MALSLQLCSEGQYLCNTVSSGEKSGDWVKDAEKIWRFILIVIPAIDLKEGKCVRLLQGRMEDATVYSDNPAETAKRWEAEGAGLLHIVDLDGAFAGGMKNISAIEAIRKAIRIPIEVGGGIRDMERIDQLLSFGVNRIILGTVAVERPELVKEACKNIPAK